MEELAAQPIEAGAAVVRIAGHGVAYRLEVDANLMRAPGLEPHAQERRGRQRAFDAEVRARLARRVRVGRNARAGTAIAADGGVDRAAAGGWAATHEREVFPLDPARGQHRAQRAVYLVRLGDDEQARRVAIEPVHDPRTPGVGAAGRAPGKRLHERPLAMPARRVN